MNMVEETEQRTCLNLEMEKKQSQKDVNGSTSRSKPI